MSIYEILYYLKKFNKIILQLKNQIPLIYKKYLYFNRDSHSYILIYYATSSVKTQL